MTAEHCAALHDHLNQPDPPDLKPRRHHLTQAGRVDRALLVPKMAMAHLAHALRDRDEATS